MDTSYREYISSPAEFPQNSTLDTGLFLQPVSATLHLILVMSPLKQLIFLVYITLNHEEIQSDVQ